MSQNKIYVGNLAYSTDEQSLRNVFSTFGNIASLVLITDKFTGQSKGFGFIEFDSKDAVESALEYNGTELDGRAVKVSIAKERAPRERTRERY